MRKRALHGLNIAYRIKLKQAFDIGKVADLDSAYIRPQIYNEHTQIKQS